MISLDAIDTMMASHPLPAIPLVVLEVVRGLDDAQISTTELAHMIGRDQSTSAKLLQVANSPFYGLSRHVATISEAIIVLGFNSVRTLAMAVGLMQVGVAASSAAFGRKQFWRHNLLVGLCAQRMAQDLLLDRDVAFAAGLLHDIGQMGLVVCRPDDYAAIMAGGVTGDDLVEAERRVFGFDHAALGARMAQRWNFPTLIRDAIALHHSHEPEHPEPMADLVYVANWMHEASQANLGEEGIIEFFPPGPRERCNIGMSTILAGLHMFESREVSALLDWHD